MNGINWSTRFQNLSTNQLPHDCKGTFKKYRYLNIFQILISLNFGTTGFRTRNTEPSILRNIPDDPDTLSSVGTAAVGSCFMAVTPWKLNVIEVIEADRARCKNRDYIFPS